MKDVEKACKLVAQTFYGEKGKWLYNAFEAINREFFDNAIPYPHIVIGLTAHGGCLGWCSSSHGNRSPNIVIHPSVFGGTGKPNPWGLEPEWLGKCFAFDILLHECIHASVHYRLGGYAGTGTSSHNNPKWISEVNRIAPLLGFKKLDAGMSKLQRVPVPGEFTKRGKPVTVPKRVSQGNVPFKAITGFPESLRQHHRTAAHYYRKGRIPITINTR